MERRNTGWKVLVTILLIAVIGLGGFVAYDKVLKDKYFTKEDNKKDEKKNNEKTSDEAYAKYLAGLKKTINNNFKEKTEDVYNYTTDQAIDLKEYLTKHERVSATNSSGEVIWFETLIDTTGLKIKIDGEVVKEIEDVVYSRIISSVTAPEHTVYYITGEGRVGLVDIAINIENNKYEIVNDHDGTSYENKNIVSIEPVFDGIRSGDIVAALIDIDGNLILDRRK